MNKLIKLNLKNIFVISLILLLALILRLYHLGENTLSYDEATVVLNKLVFERLSSFIKLFDMNFLVNNRDYLTVYCYGFMSPWQELFGKSEFILRLPSVVFGVFAVFLLFLIGRNCFGTSVGYLSAFLLSISPLSIYYSQEVRPYSGIIFLSLMSAYSLFMFLRNQEKKYSFSYIASNTLNIYFHCATLSIFASFLLFIIFNLKRYRFLIRPLIFMHAMISLLIIPVLLSLYANLFFVSRVKLDLAFAEYPIWGAKASFKQLLFTLKNFTTGYNTDLYGFAMFFTLIFGIFILFGIYKVLQKGPEKLFLFCLLTPVLLLFSVSKFLPCYVDRYVIFVLPFYLLFIAIGLEKAIQNKAVAFFVILFICFSCFGLFSYYRNYLPEDHTQHVAVSDKPNIREAVSILLNNYRKGDKVMYTCKNTIFPFKFYIKKESPGLFTEIDKGNYVFIEAGAERETPLIYNYDLWHPPSIVSMSEFKRVNFDEYNRVWLISSNWYFSRIGKDDRRIINIIKSKFIQEYVYHVPGVDLYLFTKNNR